MTSPARAEQGVTRDDIARAYRVILGREPEDENAYRVHAHHQSYNHLLGDLLRSHEFRRDTIRPAYFAGLDPLAILKGHESPGRSPVAGSIVNFLGISTDLSFVSWAREEVEDLPIPGNFHATEAEWVAALRAVDLASERFVVVELGAGWGCWMANTAVAAKRRGMVVTAVGVEGDKSHVGFIGEHCATNGLSADEVVVVDAVVGIGGGAAFPVALDAASAYGQEPVFFDDDVELDRFVASSAARYRKVPAMRLDAIFGTLARIDLLHIDIQGGEVALIDDAIATLNARVAFLVVGTHGRELEGRIVTRMRENGWILEVEEPCSHPFPLEAQVAYVDGLQGWRNPRLRPVPGDPLPESA